MIKVKNLISGGYYLFQGKASANSLFIEDLAEAKQFMILANYYLKGYLKIHDYLLTIDGWNFIVSINSLEKIEKKYANQSGVHKTGEDVLKEDEIWRIISERMRILLSTFVKFTNNKQGRTGGKVHSSYERYVFERISEAKDWMEKMRNGILKEHQSRRRYRANKNHYKISKKLGRGSIFISSRKLKKRLKACAERLDVLKYMVFDPYVVGNLIQTTYQLTPIHNKPPIPT